MGNLVLFLFLISNPHISTIDSLVKANKIEECLSYLDKHKKSINTADYFFYKGECHRLKNEYEASASFFNQGLNILPYDEKSVLKINFLLGLSKVSRASQNYEKSLTYADDALQFSIKLGDSLLVFKSLTLKGNAFYAKERWDSVSLYYTKALNFIDSSDYFNQAVITSNLGNVASNQGLFKRAKDYAIKGSILFAKTNDKRNANMVLVNYLAFMEEENQDFDHILWQNVFNTASKNKWLDQKKYLLNNKKKRLLKRINNKELSDLLDTIETIDHTQNDNYINELNEKFQNDKLNDNLTLKAKELEISKLNIQARNKWIGLLGILSFFVIVGSIFYFRFQKTKNELKLTEERLKKQQAIEAERNRIASEMHDDLSSGLTTIRYLSDHAMTKLQTKEELKDIEKIANQSNSLIRNMSEIIWAMNSRFDNAEQLFAYIKRYASEYLEMHNLHLKFFIEHDEDINLSGEKRRNIFLVVKEVLHNAVKYSKAESIEISCSSLQQQLSIKINEMNGFGFDPAMSENKGNGIFNMRQRMEKIGGTISFEKEESGFTTSIRI